MAYNSEDNIDDLIALTAGTEESFYLILEDYDGRGTFSSPPLVYGLSQVVHVFHKDELQKTIGEILAQYPEGRQWNVESDDAFNMITGNNIRVNPQDTLEQVFDGEHKAVLYLQSPSYSSYQLFEAEQSQEKAVKKFNWRRCLVVFSICWIIKFFVVLIVIYLLREFNVV